MELPEGMVTIAPGSLPMVLYGPPPIRIGPFSIPRGVSIILIPIAIILGTSLIIKRVLKKKSKQI